MTVLIVEDDSDLRELLRIKFEKHGWVVVEARNGLQGFNLLSQLKIDLVLCDIQMPIMDGIQFLKCVQRELSSVPPIYILSGSTSFSDFDLIELGAKGFLQKPLDVDMFLRNLRRVFRVR